MSDADERLHGAMGADGWLIGRPAQVALAWPLAQAPFVVRSPVPAS